MEFEDKIRLLEHDIKYLLNNKSFNYETNNVNKPILLEELSNKIYDIKSIIDKNNDKLNSLNIDTKSKNAEIDKLEQSNKTISLEIEELHFNYFDIIKHQEKTIQLLNTKLEELSLFNNNTDIDIPTENKTKYIDMYQKHLKIYKLFYDKIFKDNYLIKHQYIERIRFYCSNNDIELLKNSIIDLNNEILIKTNQKHDLAKKYKLYNENKSTTGLENWVSQFPDKYAPFDMIQNKKKQDNNNIIELNKLIYDISVKQRKINDMNIKILQIEETYYYIPHKIDISKFLDIQIFKDFNLFTLINDRLLFIIKEFNNISLDISTINYDDDIKHLQTLPYQILLLNQNIKMYKNDIKNIDSYISNEKTILDNKINEVKELIKETEAMENEIIDKIKINKLSPQSVDTIEQHIKLSNLQKELKIQINDYIKELDKLNIENDKITKKDNIYKDTEFHKIYLLIYNFINKIKTDYTIKKYKINIIYLIPIPKYNISSTDIINIFNSIENSIIPEIERQVNNQLEFIELVKYIYEISLNEFNYFNKNIINIQSYLQKEMDLNNLLELNNKQIIENTNQISNISKSITDLTGQIDIFNIELNVLEIQYFELNTIYELKRKYLN